jgi:hypothetical protein
MRRGADNPAGRWHGRPGVDVRWSAQVAALLSGWQVDDQVLGPRRAIDSRGDGAGSPLLRLRGVVLGGTFQLSEPWRSSDR